MQGALRCLLRLVEALSDDQALLRNKAGAVRGGHQPLGMAHRGAGMTTSHLNNGSNPEPFLRQWKWTFANLGVSPIPVFKDGTLDQSKKV
jgi:hypothetical protein